MYGLAVGRELDRAVRAVADRRDRQLVAVDVLVAVASTSIALSMLSSSTVGSVVVGDRVRINSVVRAKRRRPLLPSPPHR